MGHLKTIKHQVDICIVGGGLSGMCAAIAAARLGSKVVLMHDRPVLGGNASSEVRMWVCGAHGDNNRETGIIEEIMLENYYRNPTRNYSIWDSIFYEKVKMEPNITLLLNCSCLDAQKEETVIQSIKGWQLTTQLFHEVKAAIFIDCSGDSILAPLTDAEYTYGREARDTFNEDIAPERRDEQTMGMSCLIQGIEKQEKMTYIPPSWAEKFDKSKLPYRQPNLKRRGENYWYLELGGEKNTIEDTEEIRDELLKVAFGMWDYIKNSGEVEAENWDLDWVGFLPGKRESRRYIGDYILTQNDVRAEGKFEDIIAYGGWTMDDHHPGGLKYQGEPTTYHWAPSPYGIPYRCLYSKNIDNLIFAGRNISVTHTAMSSTRVMATCALLGQAAGTAAHLAVSHQVMPRQIAKDYIEELKEQLMEQDCYLPFNQRKTSNLMQKATLRSSREGVDSIQLAKLYNGYDRPIGSEDNGWTGEKEETIEITFEQPEEIKEMRIVFDSDLNRTTLEEAGVWPKMEANRYLDSAPIFVPKTMTKGYSVEILNTQEEWIEIIKETNNYQRLRVHSINQCTKGVRFKPLETWGSKAIHLFALEVR